MSPYITPTEKQFEQLRGASGGGPIVMVNLLRFKPDGARLADSRLILSNAIS
jgi:hypothetical protein